MSTVGKNTLAIYRDCMRLIEHMAGQSQKAITVKSYVRDIFRQNRDVTDAEKIEELRNCAIQGISNYLTVESLSRLKKKGAGGHPVTLDAISLAEQGANMNDHDNAMYGEVKGKQ